MEVCNHVPKNLLPLATTKQRLIPFGLGSGLNRKSTSGRKKDDNGSHKRNGFIALPVNGPQENGQVLNGRSCENQDSTPGQDVCDHAFNGIDENCSNFAELEVKLCNLAVELEANTTDNAKLCARVLELKQQASCLAEELQKVLQERKEQEEKHMEQRAAVRQQLEVQIQTISVLVAEKHDLLTSLKHTQRAAEQKACEAQDLASRLHASHRHVVELEQSLATAASYHRHFEHLSMQLQKEKEECKIESNRLKKDREDLKQQTSELSERLKSKQQEAEIAQAQLLDVQRKLELSQLNIQQLSSHLGAADSTSQLQIAQEQVQNLELRLEQAEEVTRQLGVERDWLMQQLQESSANWQEHARHTTQQMTELVHEKDVSIARVEELKFSLAELQEQIVDLQTQQKMAAAEALVEQEISVEKSLQEQLKTTEAERDELLALYKLQDAQLSEFKSDLEIYREQTHDHKVLLEDKQSDKATISKALSQNKQLKQEVEDLQFALAAVSSENRETRSALQVEQHGRQKVETELEDLRKWFESLTRKLVDKSSTMNVDSSQHVLESSVTQLLYQRDQLARQCQMQNEVVDLLRIESGRDRQENYQLRDSLFVLNSEMGKWKEKSEALQKQVDLISQEQQQLRKTAGNDNGTQGLRLLQDEAHCHNHNDLQTAMDKLQEKFLTVMEDKVELMESKELLEYNYTELSKKTKTLGEYVAFYMRHCETLSQRHEEQGNSVRRLQKDNAILTGKVNELQSFADPLSANESDSSVHCSTTKRTNEVMWL